MKDQVPVVLSIYAYSFDQPLPSSDEILFCSTKTTSEDVENFLRIVLKSNGNKIYTILNIQELTYSNSESIERFLTSDTQAGGHSNYNLVCICSQEKHAESILATSIASFRVTPIILPLVNIRDYLMSHFVDEKNLNDSKSLPFYDFEKSSVRALISKNPGNGKSSYVKSFISKVSHKCQFNYECIRVKKTCLDVDKEFEKLFKMPISNHSNIPTLFHIDIAFETFHNVDLFLFNLLVVGELKHSNGLVWRKRNSDLYFIEIMPPFLSGPNDISYHSILNYLPQVNFRTPRLYLYSLLNSNDIERRMIQDNHFQHQFLG